MRLLISSPFHDGPNNSFCLYFDCGTYTYDSNTGSNVFNRKNYYFATNDKGERYKYNSPSTYIKKTNDIDCRPYLEVISENGYIYTGPNTKQQEAGAVSFLDYRF